MSRIGKEGQARVLKEEEFHRVIAHVRDTSRFSVRDCAILQVSYRCGLRAKEIAGLTLEDVLDMDGNVKEVITLRSKITKGSKVGKVHKVGQGGVRFKGSKVGRWARGGKVGK